MSYVALMRVKFGVEELTTKFHPSQCRGRGMGPPKLWILRNLEHKCPHRGISLQQFLQNFGVCGQFHCQLMFLMATFSLKFSVPLAVKLYARWEKFWGSNMVWMSSVTCQVWWGLDFARCWRAVQKSLMFFVCSLRFWMAEFVDAVLPLSSLSSEMVVDVFG